MFDEFVRCCPPYLSSHFWWSRLYQLGKEQLLDALRFGADQVFRSKDTSITDADIDAIMAHGKASTRVCVCVCFFLH